VNPIYPSWYTKSPLRLLRHSLTTLGISVMETLECTLERGVHPGTTVLPSSLTEPVKWNCPEYIPGLGILTENIHRRALEFLLTEPVNQALRHRVTCEPAPHSADRPRRSGLSACWSNTAERSCLESAAAVGTTSGPRRAPNAEPAPDHCLQSRIEGRRPREPRGGHHITPPLLCRPPTLSQGTGHREWQG
jgi:hypothetical protein